MGDFTIDLKVIVTICGIFIAAVLVYLANGWRNRKSLSYEIVTVSRLPTNKEEIKKQSDFQIAFLFLGAKSMADLVYVKINSSLFSKTIDCGFLSPFGLSSFGFLSGLGTMTGGFSLGGGSSFFCAEAVIEKPTTSAIANSKCFKLFIILFSSFLLISKARGKVRRVRPFFFGNLDATNISTKIRS